MRRIWSWFATTSRNNNPSCFAPSIDSKVSLLFDDNLSGLLVEEVAELPFAESDLVRATNERSHTIDRSIVVLLFWVNLTLAFIFFPPVFHVALLLAWLWAGCNRNSKLTSCCRCRLTNNFFRCFSNRKRFVDNLYVVFVCHSYLCHG